MSLPQCLTLTFSPSLARSGFFHIYTRTQVVNILNTRASTHTPTQARTYKKILSPVFLSSCCHIKICVLFKHCVFGSYFRRRAINFVSLKKSDQLFNQSVDRSTNRYTELPHEGGNIKKKRGVRSSRAARHIVRKIHTADAVLT